MTSHLRAYVLLINAIDKRNRLKQANYFSVLLNSGFQTTHVAEEVIMAPATRRLNAHPKVGKVMEVAHRDSVYAVHVSSVVW